MSGDSAATRRPAEGVVVATTRAQDAGTAVAGLCGAIAGQGFAQLGFAQLVVFFSPGVDAAGLAAALGAAFPGVPVCGCSTAGAITPYGFIDEGVLLVGFAAADFIVSSGLIEAIATIPFDRTFQVGLALRADVLATAEPQKGESRFGLLLVDGVSNCEERIVAALFAAIHDFALVGGSAGDDLAFRETTLIFNGRLCHNAAIVLLLRTTLPTRTFRSQHLRPTGVKLVVTAADVERRIVHQLNAEPAASEYAAAIGIRPQDLSPLRFATHPIAIMANKECYCRAIRNVNDDGSLTFYCAIDEGLVLTVAEPADLVATTRATLDGLRREVGAIGLVLGFECILRRIEAQSRQAVPALEALYREFGVVGFHTYGEQLNGIHLNQTLTGIAIGTRTAADARHGA